MSVSAAWNGSTPIFSARSPLFSLDCSSCDGVSVSISCIFSSFKMFVSSVFNGVPCTAISWIVISCAGIFCADISCTDISCTPVCCIEVSWIGNSSVVFCIEISCICVSLLSNGISWYVISTISSPSVCPVSPSDIRISWLSTSNGISCCS